MTRSIKETLIAAAAQIDSDTPRLDAELLLCHVLQQSRTYLFTWPERCLTEMQSKAFAALLDQRLQGRPVAHLLGQREFWGLSLRVNDSTLIPRPDTETLVSAALALALPDRARVVDLGTGTGAIALALASERPQWQVDGVDVAAEVVELAQGNARDLGLERVSFWQSSWFERVQPGYHLIVSNPPYIDEADPHLQCGDVRFEPRRALVAGEQGFKDLQHLIDQAPSYLESGGWLVLEHGYQQAARVRELLAEGGFGLIETQRDLGGQERVTLGCWHTPMKRAE